VALVGAIRQVDGVFPENDWEQKRADIVREKADIFAMGDDWVGKFDDLSDLCDVVYLPRTRDISTTEIKQLVTAMHQDKVAEVEKSVMHTLELLKRL
jgi:glycerol-3-phosphate cytidylyltransferase